MNERIFSYLLHIHTSIHTHIEYERDIKQQKRDFKKRLEWKRRDRRGRKKESRTTKQFLFSCDCK